MTKPKTRPPVTREPLPPGKTGPRRIMPDLKTVKFHASRGLSMQQIADAMGIAKATLMLRKREFAAVETAIREGQADGIAHVTNALYQMAVTDRNVAAAIFYLKNRAGWKDKIDIEQEFNLPLPLIIETVREVGCIDVLPIKVPTLKDAS